MEERIGGKLMEHLPRQFIAATTEYTDFGKCVSAPYFRKKFVFEKGNIAKIRICGLGFYELYINGKNVTKGRLAPYIANPDESLYYDDYDVTAELMDGENVIGVLLGNGFQNNPYGDVWDFDKATFRSAPKFAMAFYVNGELSFESDETFVTKASPITFDDLRAGEHYDARLETPNWNLLGLEDSDWNHAILAGTPRGLAKICEAEPILVHQELKPVSVVKTPKGNFLYDFGVNFTGVCRLKITGERGQEVRLHHGEMVIDGDLDMENLSFSKYPGREEYNQCDWYTLKGGAEESYTPRFTYHGFRYVSVSGITDTQATKDLLTFEIMHSNVKSRGEFVCSDWILNAIQESTKRSDLSNLFYIPTDCPHREKNGWTGDIALSAEQMLLNFSVEKTLEDWLFSVRNAQDSRGAIPGIVPTGGWGFAWGAGPWWDDVLFECAYQMYRYSGNPKVIYENADAMEKYLRYMQTMRNEDGLFCYGLGDWCQPKHPFQNTTPTELTDSIKCIEICEKAAKMANVIGRESLVALAKEIAEETRLNFKAKYIQDGKVTVAEQTAVACVLYYGIADEYESSLQQQLLDIIADSDEVFTTGVLGARVLFRVLSDMGKGDLAYKLIAQNRYPSYGYHIVRGARTLLENFFELKEGSWQCVNGRQQDSFNHHFWGDVSAWFIAYVTGIKVNPNFYTLDEVVIAPDFISALDYAEGKFEHRKGEIISRWERNNEGNYIFEISIPEGVNARLCLPSGYNLSEKGLRAGKQQVIVNKI